MLSRIDGKGNVASSRGGGRCLSRAEWRNQCRLVVRGRRTGWSGRDRVTPILLRAGSHPGWGGGGGASRVLGEDERDDETEDADGTKNQCEHDLFSQSGVGAVRRDEFAGGLSVRRLNDPYCTTFKKRHALRAEDAAPSAMRSTLSCQFCRRATGENLTAALGK